MPEKAPEKEPVKAKEKVTSFKPETLSSCLSVSLDCLDQYTNVYYGLFKSVRAERLNFGIWLRSSKCLIEFINPALDIKDKEKRLSDLQASLAQILKLSQILVKKEDYKKLIDHVCTTRKKAFAGSGVEEVVSQAYLKISEYADSIMSNISPESVREAQSICIEIMTILSGQDCAGFLQVIIDLVARRGELYNHTVLVSLLSCVLAKAAKIPEKEIKILSIGALFHDIGLTTLDMNVILPMATDEDRRAYERHPSYGIKKLFDASVTSGRVLPDGVYDVISQHHERFNGRGFPNGRHECSEHDPKQGICQLARIIGIADQYVSFLDDSNGRPKYSPKQALDALNRLDGEFDPNYLSIFNKVMLGEKTISYSGNEVSVRKNR